MTLYIYQPGIQPLGQFDCLDAYASATYIKGGEVGTLFAAGRTNTSTEKAAQDALDGYTNTTDVQRAAVAPRVNTSGTRPLWLLDEGTAGYGVLFGSVIGTPVGLSTTGTNLGPHTTAGSGKVTCWDKPGIYAISVDAVSQAADGIVMANANCDPGAAIRPQADGVLTMTGASLAIAVTVARFVEFETMPFLVTTPSSLLSATNTPVRVVISYRVE
jgi:hypothetical protein